MIILSRLLYISAVVFFALQAFAQNSDEDIKIGEIVVEGNKVTLTPVANKKYKLKAISVKTISGKKVPLKKVNGKYQFTMPKSNVIVSASFKKK